MGRRPLPRLHLVTDDRVLAGRDFEVGARDALRAGGGDVALHLRGPGTASRRLHELALALREDAEAAGSLLLVNDRVDVALAADLAGVHLPGGGLPVAEARALLGPGAWIGVSIHDAREAARAADAGTDFVVVGTVFATSSHPGREPAGPAILEEAAAHADVPLVAIGGVTPDRVAAVVDAGAHGVAVLSGVWGHAAPGDAVGRYLDALDAERPGQPR